MQYNTDPCIDDWYKDADTGSTFEVVAIDQEEGTIEIQYYAGEIEELDVETWYELSLKPISAPDNWSGPFELSGDDLSFSDKPLHPEDYSGAFYNLEPEEIY